MQNVDVLLGGWLDGAVLRNQVTNSLMTITVIKVGIVNCSLLGLMSLGGGKGGADVAMQLGKLKEGGGGEGVLWEMGSDWGSRGGEKEAGVGVRDWIVSPGYD